MIKTTFLIFTTLALLTSCKKENLPLQSKNKYGNYIQQTSDGGYIVVGSAESNKDAQVYLLKIDKEGKKEWRSFFGGDESERGYVICESSDRGYMILAEQWSNGSNKVDFNLIKTDDKGNIEYNKIVSGDKDYPPTHMIRNTDGTYFLTGRMYTFGNKIFDVYIAKVEESGNVLWTKNLGGQGHQSAEFIHPTSDGNNIISGYSDSLAYLLKINDDGDEIWNKTYSLGDNSFGYTVKETSDNGFILYGGISNIGISDIFILKTDMNGDSLWSKKYNSCSSVKNAILQTADNGYLFFVNKCSGINLIKTDEIGNEQWEKQLDEEDVQLYGQCLESTNDGGYVLTGYRYNNSKEKKAKIYVVKLDINGNKEWEENY